MAAAEQVLQNLREQLNCSICLDTYTDPKLLQCFHTYCRQCLVPLVERDQQGLLHILCPTCRQATPVPDTGVRGIQSAFHITPFLDSLRASPAPADANHVNVRRCCAHEGKELELYCRTCKELICTWCALNGGKHHDHCYETLEEAFEK
jgi:tripartite motif-containing protein 2/3